MSVTGTLKRSRFVRFCYRMIAPVLEPRWLWRGLMGYPRYLAELMRYRGMMAKAGVHVPVELFPTLADRTSTTSFDPHYCYMSYWASRRLELAGSVGTHVDVGSSIAWVMGVAAARSVQFIDIRPFDSGIPNLEVKAGTLLSLPYPDRSLASLSCLHVVEHVGLGRYGDPLDPLGSDRAIAELARVLAPGGRLLFALPVGRMRVSFNAHRVHAPDYIVARFRAAGLELDHFSYVADDRSYYEDTQVSAPSGADYACGMFEFRRP